MTLSNLLEHLLPQNTLNNKRDFSFITVLGKDTRVHPT